MNSNAAPDFIEIEELRRERDEAVAWLKWRKENPGTINHNELLFLSKFKDGKPIERQTGMRPSDLENRLLSDDTDPAFLQSVINYIWQLERHLNAACDVADRYKEEFHSAIESEQPIER